MKKTLICALLLSNSIFAQTLNCTPGSTSTSTLSIGEIWTTGNSTTQNSYVNANTGNITAFNTYQDLRYTTNPINPVLVVTNGTNTIHLMGGNFDHKFCTVWIDFNADGTFGPDEVAVHTISTGIIDTSQYTINYPFSFTPSVSRVNYAMRILMSSYNQLITDSCTLPITSYNKVIDLSVGYTNPLLENNQYQKLEMTVYPNPTSGEIIFSAESDINYELYDAGSRLVKSGYGRGANISGLDSGMYILKASDDNHGSTITKIIKY